MLRWSHVDECEGRNMYHAWGKSEMRTKLFLEET
jgi:hypothetical protein